MSARDELAAIIWDKTDCRDENSPDYAADAILAAGYRKIVASRQELDALPTGAKISDNEAEELTKDESGMWTMTAQPHESFSSLEMEFGLPAVVLLEGDEA